MNYASLNGSIFAYGLDDTTVLRAALQAANQFAPEVELHGRWVVTSEINYTYPLWFHGPIGGIEQSQSNVRTNFGGIIVPGFAGNIIRINPHDSVYTLNNTYGDKISDILFDGRSVPNVWGYTCIARERTHSNQNERLYFDCINGTAINFTTCWASFTLDSEFNLRDTSVEYPTLIVKDGLGDHCTATVFRGNTFDGSPTDNASIYLDAGSWDVLVDESHAEGKNFIKSIGSGGGNCVTLTNSKVFSTGNVIEGNSAFVSNVDHYPVPAGTGTLVRAVGVGGTIPNFIHLSNIKSYGAASIVELASSSIAVITLDGFDAYYTDELINYTSGATYVLKVSHGIASNFAKTVIDATSAFSLVVDGVTFANSELTPATYYVIAAPSNAVPPKIVNNDFWVDGTQINCVYTDGGNATIENNNLGASVGLTKFTDAPRYIRYNPGFPTESSGARLLLTGTSQAVAHGLAITPTNQSINVVKESEGTDWWFSAVPDATNFYINGTAGKYVDWAIN